MKIKFTAILVLLAAINSVFAEEVLDRIVASANNSVITKSEMDKYKNLVVSQLPEGTQLPPPSVFNEQVLEKMIQTSLQKQLAEQNGISVDAHTVDQSIAQLAKQQGYDLVDFKEKVRRLGIPYKQFRDNIHDELLISKLQQQEILSRLSVSDQEVNNYLDSPLGQESLGAKYRLSHILVQIPENASSSDVNALKKKSENIVKRLRAGENFSTVAIEVSSGQQSLQGGDLGWREASQIPTIFAQKVVGMGVNSIEGPIQSSSGFHIIKLADKQIANANVKQITEYDVRQILVKPNDDRSDEQAKALLSKVRQDIISGKKSFAEQAKKYSQELSTASKGGTIGWVSRDAVIPEFYKEISSAPLKSISEPFKTKLGWHIVEVLDKRNSNNSRELAKRQALASLREQKYVEMVDVWIQQVRDRAKVKTFL